MAEVRGFAEKNGRDLRAFRGGHINRGKGQGAKGGFDAFGAGLVGGAIDPSQPHVPGKDGRCLATRSGDGRGNHGNSSRETGLLQDKAGRYAIQAVHRHLGSGENGRTVVGCKEFVNSSDFHRRIELLDAESGDQCLFRADTCRAAEQLAVEIAFVKYIAINQGQVADTDAGKDLDDRAPKPPPAR